MSLKVVLFIVICYWPFNKARIYHYYPSPCIIQTVEDRELKPIFFRNFENGTKFISNETNRFELNDQEKIIGYCKTNFASTQGRKYGTKLPITCSDGAIYVDGNQRPSDLLFKCHSRRALNGTCSIQITPKKGPTFSKKLGSRTIQVLPDMDTITINYDQEVTAHCNTTFKSPPYPHADLQLYCIDGLIFEKGLPFDDNYNKILECETSKWNLYESETQFPWCPSNMVSYLLARPQTHSTSDYEYLAGICYDIEQMSVKSVYYEAKPKQDNNEHPNILDTFTPQLKISDVDKNFMTNKFQKYDYRNMQHWLDYVTEVIIRYPRFTTDSLTQFDKLLSIDWWTGLKLGNWKFYEDALDTHLGNNKPVYDILVGVSGAVSVPMRNNCSGNFTMVDLIDSNKFKRPLYVWNYVRSLKNASEDFVVIGVNTPFVDFYDEKQFLFCKDICHEIDWLKDVRMTFRYRLMGIIICCRADEVLALEHLDGFVEPYHLAMEYTWNLKKGETTTDTTSDTTEDITGESNHHEEMIEY